MTLPTINNVLFLGAIAGDFSPAPTVSTDPAHRRTGTYGWALQGPLTITLPRKVMAPEWLSINFSLFMPSWLPATGWQGQKIITLLEDGVEKYALIMWDDSLAATPTSTTGGRMDEVIISGGAFRNRFGNAYDYTGSPSYPYNFNNSPDFRFHRDTLNRRLYQVGWDTSSTSAFDVGLIKSNYWGGGGGITQNGLNLLLPTSGINGVTFGALHGALWSEIIVTADNAAHLVFNTTKGGFSLYLVNPPDPLPHPYGTALLTGHPGEALLGWPGVQDGEVWAWGVQTATADRAAVYTVRMEAYSGTGTGTLSALTSAATGTASAPPDEPEPEPEPVAVVRLRVMLEGTDRRTISLNGTVRRI